jgi:predicted aldo/keto reductase-like oxidoreductase
MPKLGLGFMRYDLHNPDNQNIIDFAIANGINYFETCYFYLDHQCEDFVHALLRKHNRASYEICGKMSMSEAFVTFKNYRDLYYDQLRRVPGGYFDVYIL